MGADASKMVGYMVEMCENPLLIASSYLYIYLFLAEKEQDQGGLIMRMRSTGDLNRSEEE